VGAKRVRAVPPPPPVSGQAPSRPRSQPCNLGPSLSNEVRGGWKGDAPPAPCPDEELGPRPLGRAQRVQKGDRRPARYTKIRRIAPRRAHRQQQKRPGQPSRPWPLHPALAPCGDRDQDSPAAWPGPPPRSRVGGSERPFGKKPANPPTVKKQAKNGFPASGAEKKCPGGLSPPCQTLGGTQPGPPGGTPAVDSFFGRVSPDDRSKARAFGPSPFFGGQFRRQRSHRPEGRGSIPSRALFPRKTD